MTERKRDGNAAGGGRRFAPDPGMPPTDTRAAGADAPQNPMAASSAPTPMVAPGSPGPVRTASPSAFRGGSSAQAAAGITQPMPPVVVTTPPAHTVAPAPLARMADGVDDTIPPDEPPPTSSWAQHHIPHLIVVAALAICVVAGLFFLNRLGILPTKLFALAAAADVLIAALIGWGVLRSSLPAKKISFGVLTLLALVAMVANLGVAKVSRDVTDTFTGIQADPTSTVRYDIIGLVSGPSDVAALAGGTMGELTIDPNAPAARMEVLKLTQVTFAPQADTASLVGALTDGTVGSAVLPDSFLQIYAENDPEFYTTVKILANFDLQVTGPVTGPVTTGPGGTTGPVVTPMGPPNPEGTFIVYISGIDTAGPIRSVSRSDVNQLMVVNTNTGQVQLINTPRDFYVQLHGKTGLKDKLTHAGIYGIDVSMNTLADLYGGIHIDYYLRINFDSVVAVVNALGGVDVASEYSFTLPDGTRVIQGVNHFNGAQALAFSRERHQVPGGDRGRGKDQQAVIQAIVKKITQPSVLANYSAILQAVQGAMQTSMPTDTITGLAKNQLSKGTNWTISAYSVDGSDGSEYTYSYNSSKLYVMIPDQATVTTAEQKIAQTLGK